MTNRDALRRLENQPFSDAPADFSRYMQELFRLWELQAAGRLDEEYSCPGISNKENTR